MTQWAAGRLGVVVVFFALAPLIASAQNGVPYDWNSKTWLYRYIEETLKAPNPEKFHLTRKMILQIAQGHRVAETSVNVQDPAIRASLMGRFSPNSKDKAISFFQSLGRRSYNNSAFVGRAGVGKTFVVDQLVIMFSLGVVPEDYDADLGMGSKNPFYESLRKAFIGHTQFVLINDALLQLDNTQRGAAFSNHETRVKGILHDLFNKATEDFRKNKVRTVFVLEEARNLAPEVQPTLKAIVDESGFKDQDDPFAAGAETGFSVLQLTTTEEFGLMMSTEGADAIQRRYTIIDFLEPTEQEAYDILAAELPKLKRRYGLEIQDGMLYWIIANRRFFSNPPEAMPGGVLKVMERLFTWCSIPGNRRNKDTHLITTEDALAFKIHANRLPKEVWNPGPGRAALADLEDRVVARFAGSEKVVRKLVSRIKAAFRNGGREFPFFIIMGPPGSGKDTLVRIINEEMFGHSGRHLMFDFSNKDGDYIRQVLEETQRGGLPLLVKRYSQGSPHGIIAFNEVADAYALEGLKIFTETGTLFPTGKDPRERPLQLNGLFLMGQWGEDLFLDAYEEDYDRILAEHGQTELQNILMRGTRSDGAGALPRAVVDRAFLTGGVILLPPVKSEHYPKIVRLHMDHNILPHALATKSVLIEYDDRFVELAIQLNRWTKGGTRKLEGIVSSLVDGALSKAADRGLPETDISVKFTANNDQAELLLSVTYGTAGNMQIKWLSIHPNDVIADSCEWSITPSVPQDS